MSTQNQGHGYHVKLYVYDLSMGLASQLSESFVGKKFDGIWHTSVVVYGKEYFFGGGIQCMNPGTTPYGTPVRIVDLGHTKIEQSVFEQYIQGLGQSKFRLDKYHLFDNNCNHFTEDASQFLLNKSIPDEIRHLPTEFFNTPLGKSMRPLVDQLMGGSAHPNVNPMGGMFGNSNANVPTFNSAQPPNPNNSNNSNPLANIDMNAMMSNPMVQNMMGNMGMDPSSLSSMMSNPMVQNMMQQMMSGNNNNMFGGGGAGAFGSGFGAPNPGMGNAFGSGFNPYTSPSTFSQPTTTTTFSDDKSIYRYKTCNVVQVSKKLNSIITECNIELTDQQRKSISDLEKYLTFEKKDASLITSTTFSTLSYLIQNIPEAKVFPVLDLVRLIVLTPAIASECIADKDSPVGLLVSWLAKWKQLTTPTHLMILRMFCNIFNSSYLQNHMDDVGANYIIYQSEDRFQSIVDCITNSLTSKLEGIRLTAASLGCNIALHVPKDASDAEIQLVSSVVEFMHSETSNDVILRLMLILYRMLQGNEIVKDTLLALETDVSKFKTSSQDNIKQLASLIESQLKK